MDLTVSVLMDLMAFLMESLQSLELVSKCLRTLFSWVSKVFFIFLAGGGLWSCLLPGLPARWQEVLLGDHFAMLFDRQDLGLPVDVVNGRHGEASC